jgi:hypothetical protein
VEALTMETVIRDGYLLFQELLQFVIIFETIQNNVQPYIDTVQGKLQNVVLHEKNGMYGGNVEMIAITEIHRLFISVYFISEDQTNQLLLLLIKFWFREVCCDMR